jgi:hypothetical protein
MAQRFLAPELIAEGVIKQKGTVSHDEHLITRGYLHSNVLNGIHSDSANYLEVVSDGGVNKLKVKPLTVTDVTVDSTQTSLANFITNVYTGSNFQEGDIVFLAATSPIESYIHNGGTAGTADDWELINSGLSDAQIRAKFSASSGIDYNSSTGEFTADQTEIKGFFSAGTGLAYSDGQFSLSATSDQITEGSNNLFYADSLVDTHLSGGQGINYNAGVISFDGDTDDVSEGSGNLYHTAARSRSSLSVTAAAGEDVQLMTYNSATGAMSVLLSDVFNEFSAGTGLTFDGGEYSFTGSTSDVSEGTNLYYTDARSRAAISVDTDGLAYNSSTGVIALDADTDDIVEGSNLYFTNARAQAAISADPAAGNLVSVTNGEILLAVGDLRQEFANQSLTANTALALTHNLGKQLVHVSAMDGSGNKVELEITYTNANSVSVKSTVGLTGIDIAVSI